MTVSSIRRQEVTNVISGVTASLFYKIPIQLQQSSFIHNRLCESKMLKLLICLYCFVCAKSVCDTFKKATAYIETKEGNFNNINNIIK